MWQLLGNAATLTGVDPLRLITMIGQAARTARHNKSDCEHLAHRVEDLAELLTISWSVGGGPVEAAEARTLAALGETLAEAHELVVSCQAHHCLAYNLVTAHRQSERFKDVDNKITSCLHNFTLVTHIVINRRLDGLMMHTNNAHRDMTTMAEPAAEAEEFTLAEIAVATNDFAVVLSAGDSGTVYKGKLHDGREVAVKRLRRCDSAEEAAFDTELDILSPLRHGNIVRLVGWCADDDGERIVVTKLMSNGSLHDHLHGRHSSPVTLTWKARAEVLLGAARGVRYLHRRAMPAHVIHGGVTSTHILLDDDASAALTGFGGSVWRTAGVESQPLSMAAIAGGGAAYGYADPELIGTGMIKPASDVYSLGVVMLETLTGKPAMVTVWDERSSAMATMTLVSFALPSVRAGRLVDVLDRRPVAEPTAWQLEPLQLVASLAVQCLCINGDDRPGVLEVVVNLEHALELICGRGHF